MKKFTAKQRAEIYRQCARLPINELSRGGCLVLHDLVRNGEYVPHFYNRIKKIFPEWMLFSRVENQCMDWMHYWTNKDRITAFLFAAEIAENLCYPYDEKFNK